MTEAVDPDDVGTWPDALREALALEVTDVDPETLVGDLQLALSDRDVAALLDGRPLRAYHCARLLPHEVEDIQKHGLRALDPALAERRITGALTAGVITEADAERMRQEHIFAIGYHGKREGQVCACLGLINFTEGVRGVRPVLSSWGGEAIYFYASPAGQAHLRTLGTPSIVVLDLPLDAATWRVWPGLAKVLAGTLAGLEGGGADIFYKASVPASAVVAVWQPGNPEYDRFPHLPKV